jgi:hypothetical protein
MADDCAPHGIQRPTEVMLRRRLRVVRRVLEDPLNPFRAQLINITDLLMDDADDTPAPAPAAVERDRPIHIPGSPPRPRGRLS